MLAICPRRVLRMLPRPICGLGLFVFGCSALAEAAGASDNKTVLILGSTVTGGASSPEATQAQAAGLSVEVVSDAVWQAKTAEDFLTYRAIVLGDPTCTTSPAGLNVAASNRHVWGPTIKGNVVVIGTDPVFHSKHALTRTGITYAAAGSSTGAYITLSCVYYNAAPGTPVPVLDVFGGFTVVGQGGCPADSHIVAQHPVLGGISDAYLSNWGCSTHEGFVTWPQKFKVLAISRDVPSSFVAPDGTSGAPYIVARAGSGFHVAIDAGHGSILSKSGTSSYYQRSASPTYGVIEDQVTLLMAQGVKDGLTNAGIRVLMIRTGDPAPYAPKGCPIPCLSDTRARAKKADKEKVDLLVSIHTNAGPPTAHGTETFYIGGGAHGAKSRDIAERLFAYQVNLGLKPRAAKNQAVSNVMNVNSPAALTEVAFHTNSQRASDQAQQSDLDEFKLSTLIFRALVAQAITNAIKEYHDNLQQ